MNKFHEEIYLMRAIYMLDTDEILKEMLGTDNLNVVCAHLERTQTTGGIEKAIA